MTITLAYALKLIDAKKSKVSELRNQRDNSAMIVYDSSVEEEYKNRPDRSVDDLTLQIKFINSQIRRLAHLISVANTTTVTTWEINGEKQTLGNLILLLWQYKDEKEDLKSLSANRSKKEKISRRVALNQPNETYIQVTDVLYNPKEYGLSLRKLEKEIDVIQQIVNDLDVQIQIPFVDEDYVSDEVEAI